MKILIVASLYPPYVKGGGEISTQLLAEGLKEAGEDVVVVSIGEKYKEEFINGVKIYRIPTPNIYWSFKSYQQSKIKKLLWHMIDSYNINIEKWFSIILEKENPQVVHSSTIEDISPYIWKIAKSKGIFVVHTLRSYTLLCPRATMFKNNKNCNTQCFSCKTLTYPKKILSSNVDAVVGISNFILNKHLECGYFKNVKIKEVIYNPFLPLSISRETKKEKVLGFVGRLENNKGIEFLLDNYKNSNFENKLYIFGSTKDKEYENYLKETYLDNRIIFCGQKPQKEIYNKITHLIVPSLWNEPFGRIIVEAYSVGIPVLGSNTGGITELVKNSKTGYIFDINNNDDFLEKLKLFLNTKFDETYIKNFSLNFTSKKIVEKYKEIYQYVIV